MESVTVVAILSAGGSCGQLFHHTEVEAPTVEMSRDNRGVVNIFAVGGWAEGEASHGEVGEAIRHRKGH
jgi:hypothetical protein